MSVEPDLTDAMRHAVDDVAATPTLLESVRRHGLRRLARRRAGLAVGLFGAAAAVVATVLALQPTPPAEPPTGQPSLVETRSMPDLVGMSDSQAQEALTAVGITSWVEIAYVASEETPKDHVIAQDPEPGEPVASLIGWRLTYSAGGPAVPISDVPAEAADLLRGRLGDGEEVLVVETNAGTAYKTNALLVGPCPAVEEAYRMARDPTYDMPHDQHDQECY